MSDTPVTDLLAAEFARLNAQIAASQSRVARLEAALTSCRELLVTTKEFYLAEQYRATLNLVDSALTNDAGEGA